MFQVLALIALMKECFKCQLVCLSYSRKLAQATYLKYKLRQKFVFHSTNHHHFLPQFFFINYTLPSHRCHQKNLIPFLLAFLILLVHCQPTNIIIDLTCIWCNSHSLHPLLRQSNQQYSRLSKWPNMLALRQALTENLSIDFYNRISAFWNQHSFIHRSP